MLIDSYWTFIAKVMIEKPRHDYDESDFQMEKNRDFVIDNFLAAPPVDQVPDN